MTDTWLTRTRDGNIVRGIEHSRHDVPGVAGIAVDGWETIGHPDTPPAINLYDITEDLSADQARALAAALVAAADALDKITGDAPPFA